jgi:hypothetical protein
MNAKKIGALSETGKTPQTETFGTATLNPRGRQGFGEKGRLRSRKQHQNDSYAFAVRKEGRSYKPLPREFHARGFNYRLIAREADVAIYEQTWRGIPNPSIAYEVVRIRRHDGYTVGGKYFEPAEVYPSSEQWGAYGFTYTDRDAAFQRLKQLSLSPGEPAKNKSGTVGDILEPELKLKLKPKLKLNEIIPKLR